MTKSNPTTEVKTDSISGHGADHASSLPNKPRIAVGIASAGRVGTLVDTVLYIAGMADCPERLIVCVPDNLDAGQLVGRQDVEVLIGQRGLTLQRNRILLAAGTETDILVFLDDDFIPSPDFFMQMAAVFVNHSDVAIATGHVLADGILGDSISMPQALEIITRRVPSSDAVQDVHNAYGCNMALRMSLVTQHRLSFDEHLPLYGWLEDVDFSRAMARYGRSVHVMAAQGVHMGVKSARQPGLRLGYSQMANPFYMVGKKTLSPLRAAVQMSRNFLANTIGSVRSDISVDRRGRLLGNCLAIADILAGKASPARILELGNPGAPETRSDFIKTQGN